MPLKRSSSDPDILMSARGVNKVRVLLVLCGRCCAQR
jgi:hypothetical protein